MNRDEQQRLLALVRPHGRTWEERTRELQQAISEAKPRVPESDQLTLPDRG